MDRLKYLNIVVINGINADIFKKIFLVKTSVCFIFKNLAKRHAQKGFLQICFNNEKSKNSTLEDWYEEIFMQLLKIIEQYVVWLIMFMCIWPIQHIHINTLYR